MHGNAPAGFAVDPPDGGDVHLGNLVLRPAPRELVGPAGTVTVEPKIVQVLLTLAANPGVVTRRQLEQQCWGTVASDEMINRAVAAARRALRVVGADAQLQTIPRTGYRWIVAAGEPAQPLSQAAAPASPRLGRRAILLAGLAAAGTVAATGVWLRSRSVPGLEPRLEQVRLAWRMGRPDRDAQALGLAREAVKLAPDNAEAWGWQALMLRNAAEYGPDSQASAAAAACEAAARQALALDAEQPLALTALATLPPLFGNWVATCQRLGAVLAQAPGNPPASDHLGVAEFAMGRVKAAAVIGEALVEQDPLAAVHQHKHIYRLWTLGKLAEMDRVADRAFTLWPDHAAVFMARLWTLAFTGRVPAARGMLADGAAAVRLPPALALLYDQSFVALGGAGGMARQTAIAANLDIGQRGPAAAVLGINHLAALGAIDEAFTVANAWLRHRGPLVVAQDNPAGLPNINEMRRRKTMMLFVPTAAGMRADPRFAALMDGIGLARDWAKSGLRPDYQLVG